jgi:hypothetical protein
MQQQEGEQDVNEGDLQGQTYELGLRDLAGCPASIAASKCPGGKKQCAGQHEANDERGALLRREAAHGLKGGELLRAHSHG